MALWHRIGNLKLRTLCTQFKRSYIHLLHASAPKPCPVDIPQPNPVFHGSPNSVFSTVRFFAAPVQVKHRNVEEDPSELRLNEKITASYVRLVEDDGHSIVPRFEALERAKALKLDLVEADMTLRKDIKEVRFSEKTETKDLKNKAGMIIKLMEKGYRVKCKVSGKENQDPTVLFSPLLALMEDVYIVESGPHMARKDAYMVVRHVKFGQSKKSGKKFQNATNVTTQEGHMETSTANSSDSVEYESHDAESGFETEEEAPFDGDKLFKSSRSAFSSNITASPDYQTNAAPINDPVSPPVSENRYRRTNHHGENNVQSNAQVPPAVTENNRYRRVEPRNRFQQTSNNADMNNYQGPGTRDGFRSPPQNWNRPKQAPANVEVDPRIENNRQAFTPHGSRHSIPSRNLPPNGPNTPRPGYGNFSGPNEGIPKPPGAPNTPRPSSYGSFSAPNDGIPKHHSSPNTPKTF
ncbi:unnamed protein product [Sphenostylis stenocarpa]|uniref:Translation initiation factor 3 N-terminal domain-containing protein n=1 Tax=Sphenostylis stenocarpa TaxID=92480 RepID=A0AA86W344_9FABA|nr:unnamed protein product [Sphenostylis stenocarpa]